MVRCSLPPSPCNGWTIRGARELDGLSVWSSRTHGWLELGFDVGYFDRALSRTGWTGRRVRLGAHTAEPDVIVARATTRS